MFKLRLHRDYLRYYSYKNWSTRKDRRTPRDKKGNLVTTIPEHHSKKRYVIYEYLPHQNSTYHDYYSYQHIYDNYLLVDEYVGEGEWTDLWNKWRYNDRACALWLEEKKVKSRWAGRSG